MSTVIAVANQKGGVGKTTIALALATAFADLLKREVLFIDLDTQANATVGLGHKPQPGVGRWLGMDDKLSDVAIPVRDRLALVPSNSKTDLVSVHLANEGAIDALQARLQTEAAQYDFVIIDCPPSVSMITRVGLYASNLIAVPVDCEFFGLQGVATLAGIATKVAEQGGKGRLVGIIPNKWRSNVQLHQANVERLKMHFGERVWDPLPLTAQIAKTQEAGVSLWDCKEVEPRHKNAWAAMVKRMLQYA